MVEDRPTDNDSARSQTCYASGRTLWGSQLYDEPVAPLSWHSMQKMAKSLCSVFGAGSHLLCSSNREFSS